MTEFPDIPGGRIAYGTSGTGPLVLLAHSLGDMRQAHRFPAPLLTGAGYRVAVMDMRGHGQQAGVRVAPSGKGISVDLPPL